MSRKGNFVLAFLLSFAITSMYSKIQIVLDQSLSGWSIHWQTLWRTTWELFPKYSYVMVGNVFLIIFALYCIWRESKEDKDIRVIRNGINIQTGVLNGNLQVGFEQTHRDLGRLTTAIENLVNEIRHDRENR